MTFKIFLHLIIYLFSYKLTSKCLQKAYFGFINQAILCINFIIRNNLSFRKKCDTFCKNVENLLNLKNLNYDGIP